MGEAVAVGPGGFADRVAEETGKGGEGGEAEHESDIGQAQVGILHVENRLVSPIVLQVGAKADVEVLSEDRSQVAFRHVERLRDFGDALQAVRVLS